jgi:hypothetical protein
MISEEIINCPKSGGDLCYKTQLNPEITTYLSLSCGFWTNTLMKEGEEFYEQQMQDLPELYKDLAWTDSKTDLVWIPNTINNQEQGMVFAYGPNKDSWGWGAAKAIQEEGKWKMDLANMQVFAERDYMDALSFIGVLPE